MSDGKRNHFIPKFFLNRFATQKDKKGRYCKIWEMGRGVDPRLVNTKNVAVETHFYGGAETGIELAFSKIESEFKDALSELDNGVSPKSLSEILRRFVWMQAIRTRAIRHQYEDLAGTMIAKLSSDESIDDISKYLRSQAPSMIEREIEKLPKSKQKAARQLLKNPFIQHALQHRILKSTATDSVKGMMELLQKKITSEGVVKKAAISGHLKGIKQLIHATEPPTHFLPVDWQILKSATDQVVLGDLCTIAVSDALETCSLLKCGKSWRNVYLPIDSRTVLVASAASEALTLGIDEINRASASHSVMYYYSKNLNEEAKALQDVASTRASIFDDAEWAELIRDATHPDAHE